MKSFAIIFLLLILLNVKVKLQIEIELENSEGRVVLKKGKIKVKKKLVIVQRKKQFQIPSKRKMPKLNRRTTKKVFEKLMIEKLRVNIIIGFHQVFVSAVMIPIIATLLETIKYQKTIPINEYQYSVLPDFHHPLNFYMNLQSTVKVKSGTLLVLLLKRIKI